MSGGFEFPKRVDVAEAEYRRLLGWPRGHQPEEPALALMDWARRWYAEHGRPWVHRREVAVDAGGGGLRIGGVEFESAVLREHLAGAGADRAVLFAVSAGPECEAHARALWEAGKPDEYFFLELFGSAVVEQLVAQTNGELCAEAARGGRRAIAHYSPGYAGWDVAGQNALHELIAAGWGKSGAVELRVLPSGMLQPKKSLLAVVGLTTREGAAAPVVPCVACALASCQYRRAPYRHAGRPGERAADSPARGRYSVNLRALRKWSAERVRCETRPDGTTEALFRFDGTTCSNLGVPLVFEYRVRLAPEREGRVILAAECRPAEDDTGHQQMCEWLRDAEGWRGAIAAERPLLGRPLDDVLTWERSSAAAQCFCDVDSRAHKWGLALEAIHFALANPDVGGTGGGVARGEKEPRPSDPLAGARSHEVSGAATNASGGRVPPAQASESNASGGVPPEAAGGAAPLK